MIKIKIRSDNKRANSMNYLNKQINIMRHFNRLFSCFLLLSALIITSCSEGESTPNPDQKPDETTYTATFTVNRISDDFFDLGSFIVEYVDQDSSKQVVQIDKTQLPFSVTINDLNENSKLYFDLIYGYQTDAELTKDQYTFERNISLTVRSSKGGLHSTSIKSGSLSMGKDKVKFHLDKIIQEQPFESTVKRFFSQN